VAQFLGTEISMALLIYFILREKIKSTSLLQRTKKEPESKSIAALSSGAYDFNIKLPTLAAWFACRIRITENRTDIFLLPTRARK
jgi:hypothetical protein